MTRRRTAWLGLPALVLLLPGCGPAGPEAPVGEASASAAPSAGAVATGGSPLPSEQPGLLPASGPGGARVVAHETGTGSQRVARFRVPDGEPYTVAVRCSGDGVLGVEIDGRPALDSPCDGVRTVASVHADPGWDTVAVQVRGGSTDWEIVVATAG